MSIKLKDTIYDLINNADTLDGTHLSGIIQYYAPSSSNTLNLDDLKSTTGFQVTGWAYTESPYVNSQPAGDGASSAATVIKFPGNYPFQIYRFYSSNDIKVRGYYSGTGWTDWATILTSDNYTTYCASASHSHNYASTVKVGSTSYSCSSNIISLPAYPTLSSLGAAASSHTHTKSQITDFPTSMPASDVYAWAKASTKPSYTASEIGAPAKTTLSGGLNYGEIVRIDCSENRNMLITLRGTNSGRGALIYVTGYGSGTNLRITHRIIYSTPSYKFYYNGSSESGAFYIKNIYDQGSDSLSVTELSVGTAPPITKVSSLPSDVLEVRDVVSVDGHTHNYAASSHTHTKSQITDFAHTHDYAASSHNHDSVYSKLGHTHSYSASNHNHDSVYSKLGHTHDYAASSHSHNYAASSSAGGSAHYLASHDTRSATINPDSFGPTFGCHFKSNGTNGVSDGGNYYGLIHFRPYGSNTDFSGGYPHQLAFTENSNIWYRKATSSTAWSTWRKIWHSGIFDPANYMPKSGGAFTGSVTFANGTWNVVGDDAAIGDYNAAGMLGLKSCNNNIPGIGFHNSAGTLLGRLQSNGSTLQWNDQTIIHSGNIGSQSVNYATSAGNADTCDSHHFSTVSSLPASPNSSTVYFIV